MCHGFLYLCAILDWATRKVLAWRLANTLTTDFCTVTLTGALVRHGTPEIFNTDQGGQFTGAEFTDVLKTHGIQISMDGRGHCHDNIFVERLWWTVTHEGVYLRPGENGIEQKQRLAECFEWYNRHRPHQPLNCGYRMRATSVRSHRPPEMQKRRTVDYGQLTTPVPA